MFEPLRTAIAAQYSAFRSPRPRAVEGCSCCTSPEDLAALVAAPREELGAAALAFYAHKAMTTVGSVEDFRYFWPRLAELALDDQLLNPLLTTTEIIFGKPAYGAHNTWPSQEQEAIRALAATLGEWVAVTELEPDQVDTWVCVIGLLSEKLDDPRRFLRPLADAPMAWTNLRALVELNEESIRSTAQLSNSFWENAPEGAALMLDWLRTEPRANEAARALMQERVERYGFVPPAS